MVQIPEDLKVLYEQAKADMAMVVYSSAWGPASSTCLQAMIERIAKLEAELATAKARIPNERLMSRLMGLEDGASMMDSEVAELKVERDRLKAQIETARSLDDLRATLTSVRTEEGHDL